jgi:electron transport complex protein RnfD
MFPFVLGIIGSLYLIFGGVNRITPIAFLVSLIFFSYFGRLVLPDRILPIIPTLFGGSALFYLFFIFSDRWTSSRTRTGRVICGAFAGFLTILIRHFSINVEGVIFSAMFNYAFSPLFDEIAFSIQNRREAREFRAETKGVGT